VCAALFNRASVQPNCRDWSSLSSFLTLRSRGAWAPCAAIDLLREGAAPQRVEACLAHRGTTGPGGVRAPRRQDASKTKDKQVGAGCRACRGGAPRRAMRRRITTSPATRCGATCPEHVRAIARASQNAALPRPAGNEEPAVAVLFYPN